ncbi:MAG TPA: hypothetical protein VM756_05390 [Burkholderiales bacterium]|nr:hypothetical protein [Burkholderiales bacterium]
MRSWSPSVYKPLPRNVVFYDGPSQLNGERILGIVTSKSTNPKIGRMVQAWIIPAMSPIAAVKSGADAAVCGDCKLRGERWKGRSCYVWIPGVDNIWQSIQKIEKTDHMGPSQLARLVAGLQLRIGAYGDPMAVPVQVWEPLLKTAAGWTAYTHRWAHATAVETTDFRGWCMASVDSVEEQQQASARGWRTFRVRPEGGVLDRGEIVCPHENDESIHCAECSLCRGAARPAKHIAVTVHGQGKKWFPLQVINPEVEAQAIG